jgi:hypothetical protein
LLINGQQSPNQRCAVLERNSRNNDPLALWEPDARKPKIWLPVSDRLPKSLPRLVPSLAFGDDTIANPTFRTATLFGNCEDWALCVRLKSSPLPLSDACVH